MLIRILLLVLAFAFVRFLVKTVRALLSGTRSQEELHSRRGPRTYRPRGERIVDVEYTEKDDQEHSKGKAW